MDFLVLGKYRWNKNIYILVILFDSPCVFDSTPELGMDPKCRSEQSTVIFDPLHRHWHFLGQDEEEDVQHRTRTRQVAVHWSWWGQPILSDLLPQGDFVLKGLWGPLSSPLSYEFITNPLGIRLFIETTFQWLCMPAKKEKIIKYHVYCLCILNLFMYRLMESGYIWLFVELQIYALNCSITFCIGLNNLLFLVFGITVV